MLKTNSRSYYRALALVLLCGFIASGIFAHGRKANLDSPTKPAAVFCACCPEHGVWERQSRSLYEFESEGLSDLKFDNKAFMYSTGSSPDDIKGIELFGDDENGFALTFSHTPRQWTLIVKARDGKAGKLILTLPNSATFFLADITRGPRVWAAPNSVYKEIQLEGLVQGTGIFANGMAPRTKYRMVLQGQGGTCFDTSQFYRWNLRVSGAKAEYALHGFFSKAQQ